jgi:hypothetical protein
MRTLRTRDSRVMTRQDGGGAAELLEIRRQIAEIGDGPAGWRRTALDALSGAAASCPATIRLSRLRFQIAEGLTIDGIATEAAAIQELQAALRHRLPGLRCTDAIPRLERTREAGGGDGFRFSLRLEGRP